MIRLLKKFRPIDWVMTCVVVCFVVGQVYLDLLLPEYTSKIIKQMMDVSQTSKDIWSMGGKMLLICLANIGCTIMLGLFATLIATNFAKRLRLEVFEKVESFSLEEMGDFETASLITRTTNDIQQVQMGYGMSLRMIIAAPVTAVWAIIKIKNSSLTLSLSVGAAILSLLVLMVFVFVIVLPRFKRIQKLTDDLNNVTRENLTGLRVVRAYNAEDYQNEKFERANEALTNNNLIANRIMGLMIPAMTMVMSGISLIVYWVGSYQINASKIEYSDLQTFSSYSMQILMSFMMVAMLLVIIPRASVAAKRILEVLDTNNKIKDPSEYKKVGDNASLEFKNVTFKYPNGDAPVVSNISFKVNAGETLAIIGSTGAGKTTIMNMIPRFYDTTEGEVLVNGNNVKDYTKHDLREAIGYVPQKRFLFAGTIKSNIGYGVKDLSDEEMKDAAHLAMADEFIDTMPEKYDYHISQGGKNVSGGQMQRLCIARAIAKKPQIYLFDDSFSALDYKTDKEVRRRLHERTKDAVTVIVAQRIGTIKDADKIVVLDDGKVVGYGNHEELLHGCEVYKEIALSQLSKEELGL